MTTVTYCDLCSGTIKLGAADIVLHNRDGLPILRYDLCESCAEKAAAAIGNLAGKDSKCHES